MRGKGGILGVQRNCPRITPACAGKRSAASCCGRTMRDHPRTCGEKARTLIVQDEPQGSPPRMRGKVRAIVDAALEGGITPAYAGKRACCWGHPAAWGDHPRTCGEKSMYDYGNNTAQGSPPRMRGKDVASVIRNCTARITPACAGKSIAPVPPIGVSLGSPPHVRGKDSRTETAVFLSGITPACAGKR